MINFGFLMQKETFTKFSFCMRKRTHNPIRGFSHSYKIKGRNWEIYKKTDGELDK